MAVFNSIFPESYVMFVNRMEKGEGKSISFLLFPCNIRVE